VNVTAKGQVPHFLWWDARDPQLDYHVMFLKIFEANDTNRDGIFNSEIDTRINPPLTLPSSSWDFSGFTVDEQNSVAIAVHFDFTTTVVLEPSESSLASYLGDITPSDITIQIRVHIDVNNPSEMKFDLVVSSWNWEHVGSLLVFQFIVSESTHGEMEGGRPPEFTQVNTGFEFGEGFMDYAEEARAGTSSIRVTGAGGEITPEEEGEVVYLAFEYFGDDSLEYDPTIGVLIPSLPSIDIEYGELLLVIGGFSLATLALLIRIRKYD
jgi:hypothetical protein